MVKLIIRDDDANFFTSIDDIKEVYKKIPNFPISFALIPMVTDVSTVGACPETKGNNIPQFIGDNYELVEYFSRMYKEGKCDLLLHGIEHTYTFDEKGRKIPEMIWRDGQKNLTKELSHWKNTFEELFKCKIKCFVAPSNMIGKNALKAVYSNNLNFSGIISVKFGRFFSIRTCCNYLRRLYVRIVHKFAYPGLLDYGTHKELNANNHLEYNYLLKLFNYCEKHNYPLAINVHYWHMRDYPEKYEGFFKFIDYAIKHGAKPTKLSDIFE